MERAPQSYPRKSVNSKTRKIELNSFIKPGPHKYPKLELHGWRRHYACSIVLGSPFYISDYFVRLYLNQNLKEKSGAQQNCIK